MYGPCGRVQASWVWSRSGGQAGTENDPKGEPIIENANVSAMIPQRVPLLTKLTKRCPHADCRHLLIQPDPKSTRFKIKMAAANYIPTLEVGRRRRRLDGGDLSGPVEEVEQRRRERRRTLREEVDEDINLPLESNRVVRLSRSL